VRRLCIISFLFFSAVQFSFGQSIAKRADADQVVWMKDEEQAMKLAFAKAKAKSSLDQFLALAKKPAPKTDGYAVKVGIHEGKYTEYFWIGNFVQTQTGFSGRIDNEPNMVKNVKYGQIYHFKKSEIVDWIYFDLEKRRMLGNYTTCALLTKESKQDADEFKRQYGLSCD